MAGAALSAALGTLHSTSGWPVRDALQSAVRREMPIALDVVKYRGATIAPASVATTLPMATGSPLPADLSIVTSPLAHDAVRVSITAAAAGSSRQHVTLTATLGERAPLPGAVVHAPGLVPAPTGAP